MTPDQLAYLERKRQDLYDIKAKLRQYRIKRSKSLTCAIDEVDSQLAPYRAWDDAIRYDRMSAEERHHVILMDRQIGRIESAFWGKPNTIEQAFGLEYFLRQEIKP